MKDDESSTTVGELMSLLRDLPPSTKVRFQGGLQFYRVKWRGSDLVQIEFNEPISDIIRSYRDAEVK